MVDADSTDYQESGRDHHDLQNNKPSPVLPRHYAQDNWVRCSLDRNSTTVSFVINNLNQILIQQNLHGSLRSIL